MEWDSIGASVVSSVSRPSGHNTRGKSREFALFQSAERHAMIELTEGRNGLRLCFPNGICGFEALFDFK